MPVSYFSSTGAVSFAPVPPRDWAVGPIEVALAASPPDEIIEPPPGNTSRPFRRRGLLLAAVVLPALCGVILAGTVS